MKKRLVAFLLVLIMVLGMLPTAALAADNGVETYKPKASHTVRVRIVPVYEDDSKSIGYDPIYDDGVWLNLTCQNQYCGSGNINHSVRISEFHPDKMKKWNIKSGYEWKGWIKYAQDLNLRNVMNPQNKTYYSWSKDTTNIKVDNDDIYMVYGKKAPTQYTYTLNFDGNGDGVSNVPGKMSYTGPEPNHSFTIPSTIPTRDGYDFKGWDTKASATTAGWQPGDAFTMNVDVRNAILYAIWEKTPVEPVGPGDTKPNFGDVNGQIRVQCVTTSATHWPSSMMLDIADGTYTDNGGTMEDGVYTYSISLNRASYIAAFDAKLKNVYNYDVTHTDTESNADTRITWKWNSSEKAWELVQGADSITADIKVACEEEPTIPTEDPNVAASIQFRVQCVDEALGTVHSMSDYGVLPGYGTGTRYEQDGDYYYSFTISDSAINDWVNDFSKITVNGVSRGQHELVSVTPTPATVIWKWEDGAWKIQSEDHCGQNKGVLHIAAVANVLCIPEEPTKEEIGKGNNVTVKCLNLTTGKNDCTTVQYGLMAGLVGGYELEKVDNREYLAKVPVTAFVNAFNDRGEKIPHNLYSADTLNYVVTYANGKWTAAPQEDGVDNVVLLTHAPKKWQEVGEFGPKGVGINATCTTSGLGPISYGLSTAFVYYDTDVVSVTYNETEKTYTAVLKTDKYVDAIAKGCNDKFHAEDARSHKLTSGNETVTWIFSVNYDTDANEYVWTAAPQTDADGTITVSHELFVTFKPENGEADFTQNVYGGEKANKPADPTKDGYNFLGWYLDDAEYDFDTAVTEDITLTAKWELATYTVVAKMELDGEPAYYQNNDYYTFTVSGAKGEAIDFDSIKEQAVAQAKQLRKGAASYTAEIHEDYAPNPVCTTYGEHQPDQTTHYLYVNVKTEQKVRVFASYDGVLDTTNLLYDGQTAYGTNLLEFLTANVTELDKAGYTHAEWYKKDSPAWKFGETDAVKGWTNVLVKYETIPHNIYAFARLNNAFCSLTPVEFGESVQLNAATLKRLGLNAYNENGYISIGTFNFADMPLTEDMYMSYYNENEFNAVVAALKNKLVLENDVDAATAAKIDWTALFKADDSEYTTTAGYPTDDADGYQLSGNLNVAAVMFKAGADDVENMPAVNYTYDDVIDFYDFYLPGQTVTMPEAPTRVGYNFLGWSAQVIPGVEDASEPLAASETETLYKAGDTYTITDGGVVFTAVWEARTDTHYKVKYYIETLDGKWTLNDTFEGKGTTGETIDATKVKNKKYEHYTLDLTVEGTEQFGVIAGDGSLVLKLYYTRNTYTYYVHHVKQLPDGSYDTDKPEVETLTGKYGAPAVVVAKNYGSHYPTNDAASKQDKTVDVDLVIVVKYDLDNHTLTFDSNGGTPVDAVTVRHGNTVAKPADPTKEGNWRFKDWYIDEACTTPYEFSTPLEEDRTVYAGYDKTSSPLNPIVQMYEIQHIKQLPDGTYDEANAVIERNFAEEGTEINATAKDFGAHYALNTEKSTMTGKVVKVTTGEDEKPVYTVLKVYYDLDNHTLTFDPNGGSAVNPDKVTVRHGAPVTDGPLLPPTKTGYNFTGWYLDKNAKTAFDASAGITEDTTVYAGWTPASPVVVVYKLTVNYVFQNGRTAAPSAVLELVPGASYNVESPKLASYNADRLAVKGIMPDHDVTETVTYYPQGAILPTAKKAPKLNTTEHFAYVQGYPNGTVKPAGNITRAETAAILFRLMTADTRSTYYSTKSGFRDVSTSAWYNTYVATLNAAGVITDSANGYFRPNDAITRAELAAMLAQFADATKAANYFTDVSASYWASNAIAVCSKLGWINGYPDGTFRPDKNVTRAEMMAMINRATGRTPQSADAFLPGMKTWTDNAATAWYYLDVQEATNSHSYTKKGNAELWSGLTSDPNWSLYE